mgnify:CR=1 FL=1
MFIRTREPLEVNVCITRTKREKEAGAKKKKKKDPSELFLRVGSIGSLFGQLRDTVIDYGNTFPPPSLAGFSSVDKERRE